MNIQELAQEIQEQCQSGASQSDIITLIKDFTIPLEYYKDTSVGLWYIDKNPKEVSKEWIEQNSFQLKF